MKRFQTILALTVALSFLGCPGLPKTEIAKITISVLQTGVNSLEVIVAKIERENKAACLKLGPETSEAFKKCYAKTAEMVEAVDKLKPQLEEALSLASSAVKAEEQKQAGQPVDYITPIKKGVCLLTKLATWLPEKYRKKIETFLALASQYACDNPNAVVPDSPNRQLYVLTQMKNLLSELLGQRV